MNFDKSILIEAESFQNKGGWVIDQQSMETIHSAYLMAHGMGVPVEDAVTSFEVEHDGLYYVWALTRDWTAVWDVKKSAGTFEIIIDEAKPEAVLGTNGASWDWQLAGTAMLSKGKHRIALHDLTGFNGRCDAILLTQSEEKPSRNIDELDKIRKELNYKSVVDTEKYYDLIVVGGGIAGICTALSASRSGLTTLLIHDRPVLGGCNSSEIRVPNGGHIKEPPYENLGNVVREIAPVYGNPAAYDKKYFEDDRKMLVFENTKADVITCERVTDIETENREITAVICTNIESGKKTKFSGKLFADCSGDAILARLGGAEVMYGTEAYDAFQESLAPKTGTNEVMGQSIKWYSEEKAENSFFPDLDWNLEFDEETCFNSFTGGWEQETGFTRHMVDEIEYIRDFGLRAVYANWSYQKNHAVNKDKFAKSELVWVSALGGKRESYRVKGDYILTQHDVENETTYPDGTANITWGIDIHYPEPINAMRFGEAFRSFAYHRAIPKPCPVPYRCLYAKDIDNLFLGGRIISSSHVAFSSVRVMRTLGMLGEVVGMAAGICKAHACMPRAVYTDYLSELQAYMEKGIAIPDAFRCGEIGNAEKYHFKDIGWWCLHNGDSYQDLTGNGLEKFKYCVKELGLNHKYEMPKKWQE